MTTRTTKRRLLKLTDDNKNNQLVENEIPISENEQRSPQKKKQKKQKKQKPEVRAKGVKRYKFFKALNKVYWVLIIGVILGLGFISFEIYNKYMKLLVWDKNDPGITLASQSLDLLYDDDPISKESKIEFMKLHKSMLTRDGDLTKSASRQNVREMETLLSKINTKSSEVDYEKLYAEVALKYSIQQQYNDLFEDEERSIIKSSVTPKEIAELNNKTFNDLSAIYIKNHEDGFVIRFIEEENDLSKDVDTFNELVSMFNDGVVIKENTLTLKDGYDEDLSLAFNQIESKLVYNWTSTEYMNRIIDLLEPITEAVAKDYAKYHEYETDIANRELAYENWKLTQQEWFDTVNAIREQALAEKRAKEEAERLRKELEAARPVAIATIKGLDELTSSQINEYINQINSAQTMKELDDVVSNAIDQNNKVKSDRDEAKKKEEEQAQKDKDKENEKPQESKDPEETISSDEKTQSSSN